MSDRCSCGPHWQDAGGGHTEYVPEWEPTCPAHGDVDALMAGGEYVDRRGKQWGLCEEPARLVAPHWWSVFPYAELTHEQMLHKIVREKHREVCPGLQECRGHVSSKVLSWRGHCRFECGWEACPFAAFAEAIDAAQQLAGGTT